MPKVNQVKWEVTKLSAKIANSRTHPTVQMSSPMQVMPYGQKTGGWLENIELGWLSLNSEATV